ncbi:MAG TPA: GntR family transcriptional regulator [Xanthobacteraceae bacterium]|jgi:DNA-binding GntR family transcriptional regulator|nr:MAG: GntR family transcriptional regulator [Rhizobiales bacterium 12-66-7]HQS07437.1 GntR family transcriptional regulator [Xanthobacteraceae bacterium]
MANRRGHLSRGKEAPVVDRTPAYALIAEQLRRSICGGSLPQGAVLLEGPLAALFGSSRSPVKQALSELEGEGLLSRFEGRGLLVGRTETPQRVKITSAMLQMQAEPPAAAKSFAWQSLYYDFEREIILRSVFGRFRVNELALARHFDVGRTVARDLLIHAREVGIVSKGEKSHWWIVPLDEARFHDLYELRILLEPVALESAIGRIPTAQLDSVEARLKDVIARFPQVDISDLDVLEADLHIDCVGHGRNPELIEALRRTRCILVSGKHIQVALNRATLVDPFMDEHLDIVRAVRRGSGAVAKKALVAHLRASSQKAAERLAAFRASQSVPHLPYIA